MATPSTAGKSTDTAGRKRDTQTAIFPLPLLEIDEASGILRIHSTTLWRLVRDGQIPVVKIGRRRLFRPSDIEEFIAARAAD